MLGTYLGVLERMAANILDSWSEEEVIDPLVSTSSSTNHSSTSLGKPEAALKNVTSYIGVGKYESLRRKDRKRSSECTNNVSLNVKSLVWVLILNYFLR